MLKFPKRDTKNKNHYYTDGCLSEYIASHIFNMLGVKAQETILDTYEYNNKVRTVVACKDFANEREIVSDFLLVKNSIIDSSLNGSSTELKDTIDTIRKQKFVDSKELEEHFWNMFIINAFIGSRDR